MWLLFAKMTIMLINPNKKLAALLGIFALLMVFFAPLISHAFELPNASLNQVICTQSGLKQLPNQTPVQPHAKLFNHCAYCSLANDQHLTITQDFTSNAYLASPAINRFPYYNFPNLASFYPSDPPSQAPPFSITA